MRSFAAETGTTSMVQKHEPRSSWGDANQAGETQIKLGRRKSSCGGPNHNRTLLPTQSATWHFKERPHQQGVPSRRNQLLAGLTTY